MKMIVIYVIDYQFSSDGIELGTHGVIATFLCLLIIPALGMGLMRLAHVSDRQGFDAGASEKGSDTDDHGNRL
jgi:hypothetical protein